MRHEGADPRAPRAEELAFISHFTQCAKNLRRYGFSYNELAFTAFLWRCSLNSVRLLLVQGNCSNAADAMTASVGLTNAAADDGTATGVEGGGGRSEGGGGEGGGGTGGGGESGGGGGYGTQLLAMLLKPPPV